MARAEGAAADLAPAGLVRWRPVRRALAAGGAALGLAACLALAGPDAADLWARRNLLLHDAEWPRRTRLALVDGPAVVPPGEPLRIGVRAEGLVPKAARLSLRGLDSGAARTLAMARTGADGFEAELGGLHEPTAFGVRAGDGLLEERVIAVEERPEVAAARMIVRPPDYIATEPVELPWNAPAFSLPRGSEATMLLSATKPLSAAECRVGDSPGPPPRWRSERAMSFTLAVDADMDCRIALTDAFGLESAAPFRAAITAVPDREPQVRIAAEGVGELVLPGARLPLDVQADDDYGTVALWLEIAHEGPAGVRDRPPVGVWEGAPRASVGERVVLSLAELELPPEGRLVLRALARDGCTVDGPNVGAGPPAAFRLVQARELLAALLLRQQDLRRDLEDHIAQQARLRESLAQQSADGLARRQQAMAGLLGLTAAGYSDVLAQMLNNGLLTEPAYATHAAAIVAPLEALAAPGGAVGRAAAALAGAGGDEAAAAAAAEAMAEIAAEMGRVRERMMLMEGYAAVLTSVHEIAEDQADLLRRTRAEQERALEELWSD